jgi:predicted CopG family antitoxin
MRKKVFTRQLAVSVSEDTWQRILKSTDEAEVSISEWIREAIEKRLNLDGSGKKTQTKDSKGDLKCKQKIYKN